MEIRGARLFSVALSFKSSVKNILKSVSCFGREDVKNYVFQSDMKTLTSSTVLYPGSRREIYYSSIFDWLYTEIDNSQTMCAFCSVLGKNGFFLRI